MFTYPSTMVTHPSTMWAQQTTISLTDNNTLTYSQAQRLLYRNPATDSRLFLLSGNKLSKYSNKLSF